MSDYKGNSGKNSDESSTNDAASFSCDKCGEDFGSHEELTKHGRSAHQLL